MYTSFSTNVETVTRTLQSSRAPTLQSSQAPTLLRAATSGSISDYQQSFGAQCRGLPLGHIQLLVSSIQPYFFLPDQTRRKVLEGEKEPLLGAGLITAQGARGCKRISTDSRQQQGKAWWLLFSPLGLAKWLLPRPRTWFETRSYSSSTSEIHKTCHRRCGMRHTGSEVFTFCAKPYRFAFHVRARVCDFLVL